MSLLESRLEDIIVLGSLLGSMTAMMLSTQLLPPPYGFYVGATLYFAVAVLGILLPPLYVQVAVSRYPYLQLVVRPENTVLHCFVEKDQSLSRRIGEDLYEARIALAYPVRYGEYGRVKTIAILHRGRWSERVYLRPGQAYFQGLRVPHPQTEIVEVAQSRMTASIDHGEPIPVFWMLLASKDRGPASPMQAQRVETQELLDRLRLLEEENAKLRREAVEWQQRALAYEDVIAQQRAETAGLLDAKAGIKEHAYETFLGLLNAFGRFDKAVEALKGRRQGFAFTKWTAVTVISLAVIAYLWMNPQAAAQLYIWLSNPVNAVLVLALVGLLAYILVKAR
jgi:hypothetical protein